MNAELALWFIERGVDVVDAKQYAAECVSPSDVALALVEHGVGVGDARDLAAQAPLVVEVQPSGKVVPGRPNPVVLDRVERAASVEGVVIHDDAEHAFRFYAPVVGPDGLTDKQRAAVGGVGLCRNCQQPKDDHLPGCALYSGEDPKAVTKSPLPPAV